MKRFQLFWRGWIWEFGTGLWPTEPMGVPGRPSYFFRWVGLGPIELRIWDSFWWKEEHNR